MNSDSIIDSIDRLQTLVHQSKEACKLIEHTALSDRDLCLSSLDLMVSVISARLEAINDEARNIGQGISDG